MRTCTSLELLVQKGRPGPVPTECVHQSHSGQPPPAPSIALVRQNRGSWWRPAASPMRSHILFISGNPVGTPPPHTAVTQLFSGPGVTGLGMGCIHRALSFWNAAAPAELRLNQAK